MSIMAGDDEAAELGRRRVVGMPLEFGAETEKLRTLQRVIEHCVQAVEHAEPDRDAAPEPPRRRHLAFDATRKMERRALHGLKEFSRRLSYHPVAGGCIRLRDGDEIIKLQADPKAIEAGTEIRSGGGNAHRDLLVFQRKMGQNAPG